MHIIYKYELLLINIDYSSESIIEFFEIVFSFFLTAAGTSSVVVTPHSPGTYIIHQHYNKVSAL